MYWKFSIGFLIASLVQAGIIAVSELLGFSTLGVVITFGQLIIHILVGQAAGFLLMVITQGITSIAKMNYGILGSIYGTVVWAVLVSVNSAHGNIHAPWSQGTSTVIASLLAFIVFGLIATYTTNKYGEKIAGT